MAARKAFALYGRTALEYWRVEAGAHYDSGELPAFVEGLLAGRGTRSSLASRLAKVGYDLGLSFPLDIAVSESKARRNSLVARCHVWDEPQGLPPAVLTSSGIYVCTPEVALLQAATCCDYVDLLQLVLEFAGCYLLSPMDEHGIVSVERPLVDLGDLRNVAELAKAEHASGSVLLSNVLRVAADGSKSPAESKLFTLFSLDRRRGGFGIPGIQLNLRVTLNALGRMSLNLHGIRPDLYEPRGRTAMEYQSDLHELNARSNDDRRSDALEAVGVRTFQVDKVRVRDLVDLSGIASVFASRAGLGRRPPSKNALLQRSKLHGRLFLQGSPHDNFDKRFFSSIDEACELNYYPI